MSRSSVRWQGWRGVNLVAITYVYFLIFAQFAFLKRLAELGIADFHFKIVMAAMAGGGILFSLLASRSIFGSTPRFQMQIALSGCAGAALLTLRPLGFSASIGVSFLIGAALGLLTVTLVTHLRLWLGVGEPLLKVGLGTGLGYLICNLPPLFTASPKAQALTAAALCGVGIVLALGVKLEDATKATASEGALLSFGFVVSSFAALVWLDSAAFFIIQNTPALKAGTWEGTLHLGANGVLHLTAALASAWLLRRRGLPFVLGAAVIGLSIACLLLLDPSRALLASFFYPIGVSLYSVALVAYPSMLSPAASDAERGRRAGIIYAVAGWIGSALGIGMGQNLGRVPVTFVLVACAVVLGPQLVRLVRQRRREVAAVAAVLLASLVVYRAALAPHTDSSVGNQVERGRHVYISEGCISCHSQYVRPNTPDVLLWGPVQGLNELRLEQPPLIGNRRQGPDLAEVGSRRSPLWLEAHFFDPREVSHASFMPSYGYLFHASGSLQSGGRGEDLIAYLVSLQGPGTMQHLRAEQSWEPPAATVAAANASDGVRLYTAYCGTCHNPDGLTRQRWQTKFKRLPPNLALGPWLHLPPTDTSAERLTRLAHIVKFGLRGTDMPGHEYLSDRDVSTLALWLNQHMVRANLYANHTIFGEQR